MNRRSVAHRACPAASPLNVRSKVSDAAPLDGLLAGLRIGLRSGGGEPAADDATTLARVADWPAVAALAARHRLSTLLLSGLRACPDLLAASGIAPMLKAQCHRAVRRGLRQLDGLARAAGHLADAGIPCLVLKGLPLGQRLYGHPLASASSHIDLLVAARTFDAAERVLWDRGWRRVVPSFRETPARARWYGRFEATHVLAGPGGYLNLHRRLFSNPHYFDVPFDRLHAESVPARSGATTFRVMNDEWTLVYLACHGARRYWETLRWLCDVAALLAAIEPDRLGQAAARFRAAGLDAVFASVARLCREALHVEVPGTTPAAADGTAAAFVAHMARRVWARRLPPGRLAVLTDWSRKRLMALLNKPDARHILHELASVGIGFRDWDRLDLPDRLFFLYVPLQPLLWLTRKPPSLAFFIPTRQDIVDRMLELAGVTAADVVYDLGCGDGRIVVTAAERFGARSIGVDIDPQRIAEANANAERAGVRHLATFIMQDAMKVDVSEATVVTLFLPRSSNRKLRPRLESQLPVSARIVSYVPGSGDWVAEGDWAANQVERFRDERGNTHTLYLWRHDGVVRP